MWMQAEGGHFGPTEGGHLGSAWLNHPGSFKPLPSVVRFFISHLGLPYWGVSHTRVRHPTWPPRPTEWSLCSSSLMGQPRTGHSLTPARRQDIWWDPSDRPDRTDWHAQSVRTWEVDPYRHSFQLSPINTKITLRKRDEKKVLCKILSQRLSLNSFSIYTN